MQQIIPPVDRRLLLKELSKDKFLRYTNFGDNELYIVTHHDSPNLIQEIGRLREVAFREAGGGTGMGLDIDEYDTMENPYRQLIVWDPDSKEILGGYRFFIGSEVVIDPQGHIKNLATSHLFNFSDVFIKNYMPFTIELGRSFIQPKYQSTKAGKKGIYSLDNLWDGLGAIWNNLPETQYFFGKVTMYTNYNKEARNMVLYFIEKHFGDRYNLITPIKPLETNMDLEKLSKIFKSRSFKDDYKILNKRVRELGENIPPLINSYMNLSPTLKSFGTVINDTFGDVEETAIMVISRDMYEKKSERHIKSFNPLKQGYVFEKYKRN